MLNRYNLRKMKKRILLIFSLVISIVVLSQQAEFDKANALYKSANYQNAIALYEQISATQGTSPELYYNIGNAYFKSGDLGNAILNYERALRLTPNYEDARNNLEFAQSKVVDNIVQIPPFFLKKWTDGFIKLLSIDQWYVVSVLLFTITLALGLFFIFGSSLVLRKMAFYAAFVGLAFSIITVSFATVRYNHFSQHNDAIIMSPTVTVKSSPDKSGTDLFQLHEGTKVNIHSTLDKWVEVKLGNGNIGWIEASNIEKI